MDDASRAARVRRKVPIASIMNPRAGLIPVARLVEPRFAWEPVEAKRTLRVRPASSPPSVWKKRYGIRYFDWRVRASLAPIVIAGLITAPEKIPSVIITNPTTPANVRATRKSVAIAPRPGTNEVRMIKAGPIVTKR